MKELYGVDKRSNCICIVTWILILVTVVDSRQRTTSKTSESTTVRRIFACKVGYEGDHCEKCSHGYVATSDDLMFSCRRCYCSSRSLTGCTADASEYTMKKGRLPFDDDKVFTAQRTSIAYELFSTKFVRIERIAKRIFVSLRARTNTINLLFDVTGDQLLSYKGLLTFDVVILKSREKPSFVGVELVSKSYPSRLWTVGLKPTLSGYSLLLKENNDVWRASSGEMSRIDFLEVLRNLHYVALRLQLGDSKVDREVFFSGLQLEKASLKSGKGLLMEKCECPAGYTGASCQECDETKGYRRYRSFPTSLGRGFKCIKCPEGRQERKCDECIEGYFMRHRNDGVKPNCEKGLEMHVEPDGDVEINLKSDLHLVCRVIYSEANQLLSMRWYRIDNKPLLGTARVTRVDWTLRLEVPGVLRNEAGLYACEAINKVSKKTVISQVRILDKKNNLRLIVKPSGRRFVKFGVPLRLTAQVVPWRRGNIRFKWYKPNGVLLRDSEVVKKSSSASQLTWRPDSEGGDGEWTVVAVVKAGTEDETVLRQTTKVDFLPKTARDTELVLEPTTVKLIFEGSGRIRVLHKRNGAPEPEVKWQKKGARGKNEPLPSGVYQAGMDLIIDYASSASSGQYVATVDQMGKLLTPLRATVEVDYKDQHINALRKILGDTAILDFGDHKCARKIYSSSVKNVSFTRGGKAPTIKLDAIQVQNDKLIIFAVKLWHSGMYYLQCFPQKSLNVSYPVRRKLVITLETDELPNLVWEYDSPPQHQKILSVICRDKSGRPTADIYFKRSDGQPFSRNTAVTNGTGKATLKFTPFDIAQNTGEYACVAENRLGKRSLYKNVSTQIKVAPSMTVTNLINEETVGNNSIVWSSGPDSTMKFVCAVSSFPPPKNIAWFFKELKDLGDMPLWQMSQDLESKTERGSAFKKTLKEVVNSGGYFCEAETEAGKISIHFELSNKGIVVEIKSSSDAENAKEGDDLTFTCEATNVHTNKQITDGTYLWTLRDDRKFFDIAEDFQAQGSVLILRKLKISSADLTCTFQRNEFTVENYMMLFVIKRHKMVDKEPKMRIKNLKTGIQTNMDKQPMEWRLQFVEGKGSALFSCESEGYPRPKIAWGKCIGENECGYIEQTLNTGNILNVTDISPKGLMSRYRCSVTQNYGGYRNLIYKDVLVIVPKKISIKKFARGGVKQLADDTYATKKKKKIVLICKVDGANEAEFSWYKDGGALPSKAVTRAYGMMTSFAVYSRYVVPNLSGNYTCVAKAYGRTAKASFVLKVVD